MPLIYVMDTLQGLTNKADKHFVNSKYKVEVLSKLNGKKRPTWWSTDLNLQWLRNLLILSSTLCNTVKAFWYCFKTHFVDVRNGCLCIISNVKNVLHYSGVLVFTIYYSCTFVHHLLPRNLKLLFFILILCCDIILW